MGKNADDLQVMSLVLICASAMNLNMLVKHTKPPSRNIPFNAIFLLMSICSFQIIGIGRARMTRSPTKERTPLVIPIVTKAFGMQCPGCVLSQKKDTGVHWRMLEVKAAIAQHCSSISSYFGTADALGTSISYHDPKNPVKRPMGGRELDKEIKRRREPTRVNTQTPIQTRLNVGVRNKRA
jgi:hypothetical protein